MRTSLTYFAFTLCALTLFYTTSSVSQTKFVATDIGSLGGGPLWTASSMNNLGQVVGQSQTSNGLYHAFFYSSGSLMTDLGTLGGSQSQACGINDSGQIVGFSETLNGVDHAFIYSENEMTDLGTLADQTNFTNANCYAYAINDAGQVVGYSEFRYGYGLTHAFIYYDGSMTDLGVPNGAQSSEALAISQNGLVAGFFEAIGNAYYHAFTYYNQGYNDLGTLSGDTSSEATGINNQGQVIGESYPSLQNTRPTRAFLYSNGQMKDIGMLNPEDTYANPTGINNLGQVVGYSGNGSETRAFVYDGARMWDLNNFVSLTNLVPANTNWFLASAFAINDSGQIVCLALTSNLLGAKAVLLSPISQPLFRPVLTGISYADNLILSWPTNFTGFKLAKCSTINGSNWIAVTNIPSVTNGLFKVNITAAPLQNCFYRLQSQ